MRVPAFQRVETPPLSAFQRVGAPPSETAFQRVGAPPTQAFHMWVSHWRFLFRAWATPCVSSDSLLSPFLGLGPSTAHYEEKVQ